MAPNDLLKTNAVDAQERHTQPPARFTEGALIRELERLGIGRPSTWATIVDLVLSRSYAFKKGAALVPTFTAMAVVAIGSTTNVVDYAFTAAGGRSGRHLQGQKRIAHLSARLRSNGHPGLKALVERRKPSIHAKFADSHRQNRGRAEIEVRIGAWPVPPMGDLRAGVPDETPPDFLTVAHAVELLRPPPRAPKRSEWTPRRANRCSSGRPFRPLRAVGRRKRSNR
jgi:DNA topoisomerase-1